MATTVLFFGFPVSLPLTLLIADGIVTAVFLANSEIVLNFHGSNIASTTNPTSQLKGNASKACNAVDEKRIRTGSVGGMSTDSGVSHIGQNRRNADFDGDAVDRPHQDVSHNNDRDSFHSDGLQATGTQQGV